MKRLTRKTWVGDYASANDKIMFEHQEEYNKLGKYEDTGLTPEEVKELAEAKAEGRLVVLPCKVGDMVYMLYECPFEDDEMEIHKESFHLFMYELWGNTVFLTREEAEAALLKEDNSNG